jgi:energy-converting hydrogenase Eha subunit C
MFQRVIDDLKDSTGVAVRLTSLAAAASLGLFIALSFLCAAAFVYVLENYGLIDACLAGSAIFAVLALIVFVAYLVRKRRIKVHAAEETKSALQTALADPMLVATGIQVIRAIGVKRLIPLLAVGGLALGIFAGRNTSHDQTPAE